MKVVSINDELCQLCRSGKVFAAEDWLKAGNKPDLNPRHKKKWAMGIAIENRNHSLVEVLLRNGFPTDEKTILKAVEHRRFDMLKLMIQYGADLKSVSFRRVVEAGNPDVVQLFFDHGADMFKDYPFYRGLIFETKIWLSFYKRYQPKYPELQLQLDMALRKGVEKESLRIVALLMWAGANPRNKVIDPDEKREYATSAMTAAALQGKLEIIKLLKPDPKKDDVNKLLRYSVMNCDIDLVRYWIGLGADINYRWTDDREESIHRAAMSAIEWKIDPRFCRDILLPGYKGMKFAEEWFSLGAKWTPSTRDERYVFHRCLNVMSPNQFVEFLDLLIKKEVMSEKTLKKLLTPKLKEKFNSPLLTHQAYLSSNSPSKIPHIFRKEGTRWYRPYSKG